MNVLRVLVVDDEALLRHALGLFVNAADDMRVVGEAANGAEAVAQCLAIQPDVVLMDLHMPQFDGVDAISQIAARAPLVKILAVTTFTSQGSVVAALRAGASGYIVKDTPPHELLQAIRDVSEGEAVLSPSVMSELVRATQLHQESAPSAHTLHEELSERELSIVRLLAQGLSNKDIASVLHLAEGTVKSNLSRVMHKWGSRDRVQVLIEAARKGLVDLEAADPEN